MGRLPALRAAICCKTYKLQKSLFLPGSIGYVGCLLAATQRRMRASAALMGCPAPHGVSNMQNIISYQI
jgi:hypothetical protein